jgi:hypothetical protein
MFRRIPQPPVNGALRDVEHHDFWFPFIVTVIGVVLLFCGARHLTRVETVDGDTAREIQLVKAFSSGGLQYPSEKVAPAQPPKPVGDPVLDAEALERWANNQHAAPEKPSWKVRVDTGAKTPCPT